ncbi:uncharacterized protein A4U43_C10F3840 [Asparagus officinalis]|uniref:Uncharacterized protein n=1 Tax=Asparagus officinalis TaxID=4686 RepID=A0A5P1E0F3_ASPOF|nr:uncharacterized protein A4U43_C10F3840 [Asparagus officinalis]
MKKRADTTKKKKTGKKSVSKEPFVDDPVKLIPAKFYLHIPDADQRPWFQGVENLGKPRRDRFNSEKPRRNALTKGMQGSEKAKAEHLPTLVRNNQWTPSLQSALHFHFTSSVQFAVIVTYGSQVDA